MLKFLIALLICSTGYAQELNETDIEAGSKFGFSALQLRREHLARRDTVDEKEINEFAANFMAQPTSFATAEMMDTTTARIIQRTVAAMRRFNAFQEATRIEMDYQDHYQHFYAERNLGMKEIGQHPPMSVWMEAVHVAVHIKLGDFWCQYFHTHDLFIVNFATPVVFNPSKFEKLDYLDHFAGHLISRWKWDHHGLAGVVSYWTSTAVCGAATAGLGVVTFVCNPISTFVEEVMDRKIAPPLGGKIWESANNN
jgi:hypothetical protein